MKLRKLDAEFVKFCKDQGINFVDVESGEEIDLGEDDAE